MAVIEESVFVAQPPKVVFDFLVRAENLPVWDSSVVEAEQVGNDPITVGTRARGTSKVLGRRFDWTTEVTELEPEKRASYRAVEGDLKFSVTNELEAIDGGTRYLYRLEADPGLGGIFGRIADPIVQRAQGRTIRANLENLAELLGEQASG
ncbi:MAG: SRPBCC family protein [Mycobacteriales bacterium]